MQHFLDVSDHSSEELQDLLQEIKHKPWSVLYKEKGGGMR